MFLSWQQRVTGRSTIKASILFNGVALTNSLFLVIEKLAEESAHVDLFISDPSGQEGRPRHYLTFITFPNLISAVLLTISSIIPKTRRTSPTLETRQKNQPGPRSKSQKRNDNADDSDGDYDPSVDGSVNNQHPKGKSKGNSNKEKGIERYKKSNIVTIPLKRGSNPGLNMVVGVNMGGRLTDSGEQRVWSIQIYQKLLDPNDRDKVCAYKIICSPLHLFCAFSLTLLNLYCSKLQFSLEIATDSAFEDYIQGGEKATCVVKFKGMMMSHIFDREKLVPLFDDIDKTAEQYYQGHDAINDMLLGIDNATRATEFFNALQLEFVNGQDGAIAENSAYLRLPPCPISGKQLLTAVGGPWQKDKWNEISSKTNRKLKKQFHFVQVEHDVLGVKMRSWEYFNSWEFQCCTQDDTNGFASTGYTPKKMSAEEKLAEKLKNTLGLNTSG